jgi:hypothetical protein
LCLPAGCGGEDPPEPWLPDYSTATGATETYSYAIQTRNVELAIATTAEGERATYEQLLRTMIGYALEKDFYWKVEYVANTGKEETTQASIKVRYLTADAEGNPKEVQDKQGNVIKAQERWWVFIKQADNTWRLSPSKGAELNAKDGRRTAEAH